MPEEQNIAEEIIDYIKICRSSPDSWYVGVTSNPIACLEYEHGVSGMNTLCIVREVSSVSIASDIVSILIKQYKLNGKLNVDGYGKSLYVYAFEEARSSFP